MAKQMNSAVSTSQQKFGPLLWIGTGLLLFALLFARAVYPELTALSILIGVGLLATLSGLVIQNQKALKSRSAAYGVNSLVTVVLVIGIVTVLNFLVNRYPRKADLTSHKIHTLSDQTIKLVRGLQNPVKATYFAKGGQRDQIRPLLDNYKALSVKFEVEYIDPDREPTRAKQVGIKKYGTLHLQAGTRDNKLEEPNEEKLTNALIKLIREKTTTLCAITGHGEKSFSSQDAEGYTTAKKALEEQSYAIKEISLLQEAKVPDTCDGIVVLGPTRAFFAPEVKALQTYLENGGRAVVAVDLNLKGNEYAPELLPLLATWHIKPGTGLVVDPVSRMLGVDSSVAIIATFSKDQAITRDFQGNCFFPFTRTLQLLPAPPASLHVQWIGQTTPKSWEVTDLKQLATGQVQLNEGRDHMGPLNAAVTAEGKLKDAQTTKNTRLVVFGTSFFATNNFSRYGVNLDLFLNSLSWIMEDESLISIRAKEEGPGKVELSSKSGTFIFLLTVVVMPLLTAIAGFVIWIFRRRM